MNEAERVRMETIAHRSAREMLDAATRGTGELSQEAVARAIAVAVVAVLADHDYRYMHLRGN